MDPEEVELRRDEYYDSESLHEILNQNAGLVLARVGSYPPWPARFSEPGEYAKMSKYRLKKSHVCVYFFGTRNFGWVPKSAIIPFSADGSATKSGKKYNVQLMQEALEEAKFILDGTDGAGVRFYDRIMERRNDVVDLPCEICNRVDDHYSNLILCDGVDCKREFHMNCLVPPLVAVPPGDWFCPECSKDPSKQQLKARRKRDAALVPDDSAGADASLSPDALEAPPLAGRRSKKEKQKLRDGSLKRRLQSESSEQVDASAAPASRSASKRSRFPRATGDSSVESSPSKSIPEASPQRDAPAAKSPASALASSSSSMSKKPATIDIASSAHASGWSADDDDDIEVESDERCLICGYGGDLVVCEFVGCTKVYHQFCLGAYPFPLDDDVTWECPRHTCALTGETEVFALESDSKGRGASPRKPVAKNLLWKCSQCPLAITPDKFPPLPSTSLLSKKLRTFLCPNCSANAPAKVQLGRVLERVWSMMATNRQGMPFCGPLLAGLDDDDDDDDSGGESKTPDRDGRAASASSRRALDLFTILAKIRGLEYEHSSQFIDDVRQLVANALAIIGTRSEPLAEAARTVQLICNEQVGIHQHALQTMDNKVKRSKLESRKQKEQKDGGPWSWKRKWPIQWRYECGGADLKRYPRMEPRSLTEWTVYITSAPLYASGDVLDDRLETESSAGARRSGGTSSRSGGADASRSLDETDRGGAGASGLSSQPSTSASELGARASSSSVGRASAEALSFPGLTLSEGTDIMMALGTLSRSCATRERKPVAFSGAKEGDYDVDGRDFFLSPSTSEMQHMFAQQSLLLRQALEAQTALQKSWLLSNHSLLGLSEHNGFSVGEGRLAAELRLANKNLRARLRNKDKLVDQLSADQSVLRSELAALQKELSESKLRVQELERQRTTDETAEGTEATAQTPAAAADVSGSGDAPNGVSSGEDAPLRSASGRFMRTATRKAGK